MNVIRVMTGNEACAEGALAAGLSFFAGYPITPSSEIAEELAELLPCAEGVFIQMEDELASIGAVIGASLTGAKAMTATSGPGFSLMQENIGYAIMAEVPCVIVNVMRGGPSTGLPTLPSQGDVMQARWGTHGDHQIIALAPYSVIEIFDLTIRAFNLAEKYRTPVILLLDEILAHVSEKVVLSDTAVRVIIDRIIPQEAPEAYLPYRYTQNLIPPMAPFGSGYRYHVTGLAHDETGFPTNDPVEIEKLLFRLQDKIIRNRDDIVQVEEFLLEDAEIGIISYGSSARSCRHAIRQLRAQGVRVGMLRLITIWPFANVKVEKWTKNIGKWYVVEMNMGQIAREVEAAAHGDATIFGIRQINGEPINPEFICQKIKDGLNV
ncbi:2-oxoacid:acceptor oxidoreductase subunit alpha [candidate division KSB1 bacterium]|nr:2-oxoacid:acceptor oxidoreductase subunit alpha [candidate division KSB1 bacterium]